MSLNTWLVYVVAVLVLTATPGPSVLMTVSTSVNSGVRAAAVAAIGSTSAIVCIMALSALGLGTVLATSETLFSVLKWAGVAYLAYLGVASLLSKDGALKIDSSPAQDRQPRHLVRGILVGASNPKALIFFTALFPQFIDPARAQAMQFVALGATFVVFEFSWLCTYAVLGARAKRWLQAPRCVLFFNRATGGVFLCAAAAVASVKRAA